MSPQNLVARLSLGLESTGRGISSPWRAKRHIPVSMAAEEGLGPPPIPHLAGGWCSGLYSEGSRCDLRLKSLGLKLGSSDGHPHAARRGAFPTSAGDALVLKVAPSWQILP